MIMSDIYWPKTFLFVGAGFTAQLGAPTTAQQGAMFKALSNDKTLQTISDRVKKAYCSNKFTQHIADLLCCLGDKLQSNLYDFDSDEQDAANRLFPELTTKRRNDLVRQLREIYDWDALKKIIKIVPQSEDNGDYLRDLFNIIDMHLKDGQGFYTISSKSENPLDEQYKDFIPPHRLAAARNCMHMLINLFFFIRYQEMLEKNDKRIRLQQYAELIKTMSSLMQKEGRTSFTGENAIQRDFYLFSYVVFSTNYDPILQWITFYSQKKANENSPYVGCPSRPIKLFNDFGVYMGIRQVENKYSIAPRYPFNEAVVQRLNDTAHIGDRFVRIGKFYYPHGSCCLRECKNCGKTIMTLGDSWDLFSDSVFPNPIIPAFKKSEPRSDKERNAFKNGRPDAIECPFCGNLTYLADTPLIMQTSFKGINPPYLEEIQREAKVCIENADHIVLLGYSFPKDDIIWRTVIATRIARKHKEGKQLLCSIITGYSGPKHWIIGKEAIDSLIDECIKDNDKSQAYSISTIKTAIEVFGIDNIRVYVGGIPSFWVDASSIETAVSDLLNPNWKND